MTIPHLINIAIHVSAGIAAIFCGFAILSKEKGTNQHRRLGKIFCCLGLVVCGAAGLGLAAFRFMPLFAIITLLVSYQLVGGWRVIYTRGNGLTKYEAFSTILTMLIAVFLAPVALDQVVGSKIVILSTLGVGLLARKNGLCVRSKEWLVLTWGWVDCRTHWLGMH